MVYNNRKLSLLLILFIMFLATSCSNDTYKVVEENFSNSKNEQEYYNEKINVLNEISDKETSLSILSSKLLTEWTSLFTLSNSNDLFDTYSLITWHSNKEDRDRLKENIDEHTEYKQYLELYNKGVLPAESVTVKSLTIEESSNPENDYTIKVIYMLKQNNETKKEITVSLPISNNFEEFNQKFYAFKDGGPTLNPQNEFEETRLRFMFNYLSANEVRKANIDQLKKLYK